MANLPIFQDENKNLMLLQTKWKQSIQPMLDNTLSQGLLLSNIDLIVGENVINHLLSRKQQGWILTDIDTVANIYKFGSFNDKTLTLTSDTPCRVGIWVF